MKNIILIAAPAAGKGTEAAKIKSEYNIPHISTGDLLRSEISKGNELGEKIKQLISDGKLVNDEIVLSLLRNRIIEHDCDNGYILDGFPRNVDQAIAYDKILDELNRDIGIVIVLDIDKEIAKSRISGRMLCPKCDKVYNVNNVDMMPIHENLCDFCNTELIHRDDDNPEAYDERYNVYINKTAPLIDYYKSKNIVHVVDSSKTVEDTHRQVKEVLGE